MKRLAILFCTLLAATAGHAVLDCDIGGASVNPANGSTTAGKTGIMRCRDRDSGELQREQELRDGRFVGLVRFYERGRLAKEHSVNDNGNMHGRAREFGPQGEVLFEGQYEDGDLRGLSRRFHPNGQLRRAAFSAGRGETGASAEFNAQAQLTDLRCGPRPMLAPAWDEAKACGFGGTASSVDLFDSRGTIKARAGWLEGKPVRFATLDEQGRMKQSEETDGQRRVQREFSGSGTLVRDRQWVSGRAVSDTEFYLNGQPKRRREWSGDGAIVTESDFRDDGTMSATGRWSEGRRQRQAVGTHQRFNGAKVLVGESTYDNNGKLTRERAWDDTGKLLRDDEVFEDGSRKAYAR